MQSHLGLDLGTGSIKGVLLEDGRLAATAVRKVEFIHPSPDETQIDAKYYLDLVWDLIRELAGQSTRPISGIAAAAASGNTLLLHKDLSPATPIISWLDNRKEALDLDAQMVSRTVGWPLLSCFPPVHLRYFARTGQLAGKLVAMSNEYVTSALTGIRKLDPSSGTPFYLLDQEKGVYSQELLRGFGISEAQLPKIVPCGSVIGPLLPAFHTKNIDGNTLFYTGSFDHPAAARAVAISAPDELLLSCGSSWVAFTAEDKRPQGAGLLADPYTVWEGGRWGWMRSAAKIGLEIEEWISASLGDGVDRYAHLNEIFASGEGKKFVDKTLSRLTGILPNRPFCKVWMVGGSAQSAFWPEQIARVMRCPVLVPDFHLYAGSVGAALLAGAKAPEMSISRYEPSGKQGDDFS
ncbi:MAG: FGGY family carbohydrate kinase [Victivallaceae bacterium]|nr:FGGY family carbohydrate kinase [Victivallaceae bacterium]